MEPNLVAALICKEVTEVEGEPMYVMREVEKEIC